MISIKNGKIYMGLLFYIFLCLTMIVLICDYVTLFFNLKYIYAVLLGLLGCIGINYALRKRIKIEIKFEKSDLIFLVILFCLMAVTLPFADNSWDTLNYHLYLQEKPFFDRINIDLFPGRNINSFNYAYADRFFYFFRYFLGYRLGLIVNYFLTIIIYYQVKKIVSNLINFGNKNLINNIIISIISGLSVLTISIISILDCYYVDLFSTVILIEIANLFFFEDNLNSKNKSLNFVLFLLIGYLFGLSFVIKMSNAFILLLFFIFFIIKNKKEFFKSLTILNVLCTIITFVMPFIIYLVYTYSKTGNPFFPYYNGVFKSKFYIDQNWLDDYGPQTTLQTIFWAFFSIIDPSRCGDEFFLEPSWFYGFLISFVYIIYYIINIIRKKKINKQRFFISIIVLLLHLVWSKFILGYSRYGLVILILGNILVYMAIIDLFKNKRFLLLGVAFVSLIINYDYSLNLIMNSNNTIIANNLFNNDFVDYKYNIKRLFSKNNIHINTTKDTAWGIVNYNSGYAQLINPKLPIINLTSSAATDYARKHFDKRLSQYKHIYTITDTVEFETFIKNLNNIQYKIVDSIGVYSFDLLANASDFFYIFEIKQCDSECVTETGLFDTDYNFNLEGNETIYLSIPRMFNNYYNESFNVNLFVDNGKKEKMYESYDSDINGSFKIIHSTELSKYKTLRIHLVDNNIQTNEGHWMQYIKIKE